MLNLYGLFWAKSPSLDQVLNNDVIAEIFGYLTRFRDFVAFRVCCRKTRNVCSCLSKNPFSKAILLSWKKGIFESNSQNTNPRRTVEELVACISLYKDHYKCWPRFRSMIHSEVQADIGRHQTRQKSALVTALLCRAAALGLDEIFGSVLMSLATCITGEVVGSHSLRHRILNSVVDTIDWRAIFRTIRFNQDEFMKFLKDFQTQCQRRNIGRQFIVEKWYSSDHPRSQRYHAIEPAPFYL